MPYNPQIHHRKSIRLKGYDYSQAGLYFITICVHNRECLFGKIVGVSLVDAQMELNEYGTVANEQWKKLPERFTNFEMDVFQIMPNHMHGIILLNESVGATLAVVPNDAGVPNDTVTPNDNNATGETRTGASPAPTKTVGDIVGAYKSLVANECLEQFKLNHPNEMMGKLWQRNYHEHIIRDEQSYQRIAEYIINNPKNWKGDKFYIE